MLNTYTKTAALCLFVEMKAFEYVCQICNSFLINNQSLGEHKLVKFPFQQKREALFMITFRITWKLGCAVIFNATTC